MGKTQRSTKVKVSHEVPLQLLEESKQFNDYDYCLPHLLDQYKVYKDYFYQAKKEGRYIIMDNSLHELGEAYDTSRLLYWISELEPDEKIAFSYGASWFEECFKHPNPYVAKMMGRLKTITNLYKSGLISDTDRVHLLGCNLPQEYLYYKDFKFIESIDTSNPIIHGLEGIRYSEGGLLQKSKQKIDKDFTQKVTQKQKENILYNVEMFRKINNL
jgi:hypothetical protein